MDCVEGEAHHVGIVWMGFVVWDCDELGEPGLMEGFQGLDKGLDGLSPLLGS